MLTHYEREPLTVGQTTYTFVSDGIESALEQARAAAGGKLLLGGGVRLLDEVGDAPGHLERTRVSESPSGVTHLRYEVVR